MFTKENYIEFNTKYVLKQLSRNSYLKNVSTDILKQLFKENF